MRSFLPAGKPAPMDRDRGNASDTRRDGLNHNKDNTDNAGQAFETQEGKHPDKWKKYVVGGIFLLLALLLLAAIFMLKNA